MRIAGSNSHRTHMEMSIRYVPFQMQIFGYNAHLYANFSEALTKSQGIVGIALLIQVSHDSEKRLEY